MGRLPPPLGDGQRPLRPPGHCDGKAVLLQGGLRRAAHLLRLTFAITAAELGHQVTVCEKADDVGGLLRCEQNVPFKKNAYGFTRVQKRLAQRAGVELRLNTEVTPALVEALRPDVLVAAIGAAPICPAIPGSDGPNVVQASRLPKDLDALGEKVAILGGGLVGAETGIHLAKQGKQVVIVELRDAIAQDANQMHGPAIGFQIRDLSIGVATGVRGTKITEKGLFGVNREGKEQFFAADTVILAVGMKPKWEEISRLQSCVNEFYSIGDCLSVGKIKDATAAGYQAARDL